MGSRVFLRAIAVAFGLSIVGAAAWHLRSVYHLSLPLEALITGLSFAYTIHLVSAGSRGAGQLTLVVLWLPVSAGIWLWSPGLLPTLIAHSLFIWTVRAVTYHRGWWPMLLDLGLCALALLSTFWAAERTGSLFVTLWCFFLAQAFYVVLPKQWSARFPDYRQSNDQFEQAFRVAESAARSLSKSH